MYFNPIYMRSYDDADSADALMLLMHWCCLCAEAAYADAAYALILLLR